MTDRIPGAPGQFQAVMTADALAAMQEGLPFTITLTRDDQPVVEGTPYSKAAVLPEALGKALCPNIDDPTPADAFGALLPKSGGQLTGPLTLSWQNLTGLRAVNGLKMGAFRFDQNTTCNIRNISGKWSALVALSMNGGENALYFISGESANVINSTVKIAGTERGVLGFAVANEVLTVTCYTNWSTGWYIANSFYDDLSAGTLE